MAHERGLCVDHTTIYRWVIKFTPGMEMAIRNRKKPVGRSWRMDETYIKINGQWEYLYRAVDKEGQTVDYLLTAKRDKKAAKRFFKKAIGSNCIPEKINIDKSGANTATIKDYNKSEGIASDFLIYSIEAIIPLTSAKPFFCSSFNSNSFQDWRVFSIESPLSGSNSLIICETPRCI